VSQRTDLPSDGLSASAPAEPRADTPPPAPTPASVLRESYARACSAVAESVKQTLKKVFNEVDKSPICLLQHFVTNDRNPAPLLAFSIFPLFRTMYISKGGITENDREHLLTGGGTETNAWTFRSDVMLASWDSEWQTGDGANILLSYQFAAMISNDLALGVTFFMSDNRRPTFRELFTRLIQLYRAARRAVTNRRVPLIKQIHLIGHFNRAEIAHMHPSAIRVGRTNGTGAQKTLINRAGFYVRIPQELPLRDLSKVKVVLDDLILTRAEGHKSLESVGRDVGFDKLDIESLGWKKSDMRALLQGDPELFSRYALTDVFVTIKGWLAWDSVCSQVERDNALQFPRSGIPPTPAALAVHLLTHDWGEMTLPILGKVEEEIAIDSYPFTKIAVLEHPHVSRHKHLAASGYYGGRNECFINGLWTPGQVYDFDLAGAYTTALAMIRAADWDRPQQIPAGPQKLEKWLPHAFDMVIAHVSFRFPDSERHPCLPVRDSSSGGLVYPLEGEGVFHAPEIVLALQRGAAIVVSDGVWFPSLQEHPFAHTITKLTRLRSQQAKGSAMEMLYKLALNAIYGKLAQAVHKKRVFNVSSGQSEDLPDSKISQPFYAGLCTSIIRATVSELICRLNDAGYSVASVTTDGILTNATEAELLSATDGALFRGAYEQARALTTGKPGYVEVKHQSEALISIKTRGNAGLGGQGKPAAAAAGWKVPPAPEGVDKQAWRADSIAAVYLERTGKITMSATRLKSLRAVILDDVHDLTAEPTTSAISFEIDGKRDIDVCNVRDAIYNTDSATYTHVVFSTKPHRNLQEYQIMRADIEAWLKLGNFNPLKTSVDVENFMEYRYSRRAAQKRLHIASGADGQRKATISQILRWWRQDPAALGLPALKPAQIKASFEPLYQISDDDLDNAKRKMKYPAVLHALPARPSVLEVIAHIKDQYPTFDGESLLLRSADDEPALQKRPSK